MSTVPYSSPVVPAQPEAASYGVNQLALFKTYSRETYRAEFGVEAPAFDPSRPRKAWFDSTADTSHPDNVAVYRVVGRDAQGAWALRQLILPAQEAATVNLTGAVQYPEYVVRPTGATRGGGNINPIYLSLEADARKWMEQFGGMNLGDEGDGSVFPIVYPPDEPRRMWYFMHRGIPVNAGALAYNRNRRGVGAPGRWDVSTGEPVWVPDPPAPTGLNENLPSREVPVRELLPNEKLQAGLLGVVGVARIDLQASPVETGFTAEDRTMLRSILDLVSKRA